jgi:hypothetical protein
MYTTYTCASAEIGGALNVKDLRKKTSKYPGVAGGPIHIMGLTQQKSKNRHRILESIEFK